MIKWNYDKDTKSWFVQEVCDRCQKFDYDGYCEYKSLNEHTGQKDFKLCNECDEKLIEEFFKDIKDK